MQLSNEVILIADDDMILRYLAKRQLTSLGFRCELAEDGADAVEKVRGQKYMLILMDVQMPKMNGLEATAAIRKYESLKTDQLSTPIVAMTANPEEKQCYDAGMNDFLFKPISLDQMRKTMSKWLDEPQPAS